VPPTNQPEYTFCVRSGDPGVATVECVSEPVFRLRGEQSAERATQAVTALRAAFFGAPSLPPAATVSADRAPTLLVAGVPILSVTREDGKANNADPRALAVLWTGKLTAAFERWSRNPLPGAVRVLLGGSLCWRVGQRQGEPSAQSLDPGVVSVGRDNDTLVLRGVRKGATRGQLDWGALRAPISVTVLPLAAQIPTQITTLLSRSDCVPAVREAAARLSARAAMDSLPGARVSVELQTAAPARPSVRLRATSPEAIDVEQEVAVETRYQPLLVQPCDELFVSNAPERVKAPASLFSARQTGRTRLLYHHLNDSGRPLLLLVELANDGEAEQQVGILLSAAGPSTDEMYVGHKAAADFMRARSRADGFTLTLPAGATVPLVADPFAPGRILSGLLELLPLNASPTLHVRVRAVEDGHDSDPFGEAPGTPHFVFHQPLIAMEAAYEVGGRWAFITIGRHAVSAKTGTYELAGNYGVLHEVGLTAHNPTAETVPVKLLFAPAGGVARGTFLVAGKCVEVPVTRSGSASLIDTFLLPPGARRQVRLITMPESASNYPIRVIARTD